MQEQVVGLRGLPPKGPVTESVLRPDEIRQRLLDDLLGDYTPEQAADDGRVYALLGLLEKGVDLWTFYRDLYSEQVAGYYDARTDRMVIVAGAGWTGVERLTYVHEFTHALQDQTYDIEAGLGYSQEVCREAADRCQALSALIEGDATLVEEQWLRTFAKPEDLQDLLALSATLESPVFDSAPTFLKKDFLFPYEFGLEYVRALYLRGGWAAVDRAYRDPPQTTEQILHPGAPLAPPANVDLGDLALSLGDGWRKLGGGVLGEWYTRLMLEAQRPAGEAETAAAGWGGDAYLALRNEASGEEALTLLTVWDRPIDASEFAAAMVRQAEARFGPTTGTAIGTTWTWQGGRVRLERAYTQTLWIQASNPLEVETLRRAVTFPNGR